MTAKNRFITQFLTVLFLFSISAQSLAVECAREPDTGRPKIGLVLGGGGARGAAHIGVIKMLEELQIPIDYITGTSMGALIGGLYATGMNAGELESVVLNLDWNELFNDKTTREDRPFRRKLDDELSLYGPKLGIGADSALLPQGIINGQKISFLLESLTTQRVQTTDFNQLPIAFRAVAADLISGEKYVLKEGNLAQAMRSSMSIPGLFSPVAVNGALLVDGGIVDNVPADVARAMGADKLIVVSVGTPLASAEKLNNLLAITGQISTIMVQTNTRETLRSLTANDILLEPELGTAVQSASFDKVDVAIPIGYAAAEKQRNALAALSISASAYAEHRRYVESCVTGPQIIDFMRLVNKSRFSDSVIQQKLNIPIGQPLDIESLDHDLKQVFALGFLKLVRYEVVEEDSNTGVIISVDQDDRGTDFIEWGLDVIGNGHSSSVNLRLGYLKTDIDELGTEFRGLIQLGEDPGFLAELYKPMGNRLRTIFFPRLTYQNSEFNQFDAAGNKLSEFQVKQLSAEMALAYEFGNYALLSAGIRYLDGSIDIEIGDPAQADIDFTGGEYLVRFEYDRLDDRYFPTRGSLFKLTYLNSNDSLGADAEFEQISTIGFVTHTWGAHNVQLGLRYKTTLDDNAPVYAQFRAGGFFNLSGLEQNEISGQHFGMAMLGYRRRLGEGGFMPAYIGGTLEYGNVAQSSSDIFDEGIWNASLYTGFNTVLGPVYFGIGKAEHRSALIFLRIGNIFGNSSIGR